MLAEAQVAVQDVTFVKFGRNNLYSELGERCVVRRNFCVFIIDRARQREALQLHSTEKCVILTPFSCSPFPLSFLRLYS